MERRKRLWLGPPTACAGSVAQLSSYAVCSSLQHRAPGLQKAKKRLMETDANSKLELTGCNYMHLTTSNSNSNCSSANQGPVVSTYPILIVRQKRLEIAATHSRIRQMTFSNRPKKQRVNKQGQRALAEKRLWREARLTTHIERWLRPAKLGWRNLPALRRGSTGATRGGRNL
jgi:hypothetical protein